MFVGLLLLWFPILAIAIILYGADATIAVLTAFAAVNVAAIGMLWRMCRAA